MEKLDEFVKRFIMNPFIDNVIIEGLNVDEKHRLVSLTVEHNKGVNFEIPYNETFNDMHVYSIFKRTPLESKSKGASDGNPFIYALKGTNGWSFNITDQEIIQYSMNIYHMIPIQILT